MKPKKVYLKQGNIMIKEEESLLCAVVSYGVAISLFDRIKKKGGLCYFLYPNAKTSISKLPLFALPCVSKFLSVFLENGSLVENLDANIFGGAVCSNAEEKMKMIAEENIKVAKKVLANNGVAIRTADCGGVMGRKIIFNTNSGELLVAKVNNLRKQDWELGFTIEQNVPEKSNARELLL